MRFVCERCGCLMWSENEIENSVHHINEIIDKIVCTHCGTKHKMVIAVIVKVNNEDCLGLLE